MNNKLEDLCKDIDSLVDYCCEQAERNCKTKDDYIKFWESYENLTVRTYCSQICKQECDYKEYLKRIGGEK